GGPAPRDRTREREPAQVAVPRQYESRAAHAAQRHSRIHGADPRRPLWGGSRTDEGGSGARRSQWSPPTEPDQRRPRPVEDRGGATDAVARRLLDGGDRSFRRRFGGDP